MVVFVSALTFDPYCRSDHLEPARVDQVASAVGAPGRVKPEPVIAHYAFCELRLRPPDGVWPGGRVDPHDLEGFARDLRTACGRSQHFVGDGVLHGVDLGHAGVHPFVQGGSVQEAGRRELVHPCPPLYGVEPPSRLVDGVEDSLDLQVVAPLGCSLGLECGRGNQPAVPEGLRCHEGGQNWVCELLNVKSSQTRLCIAWHTLRVPGCRGTQIRSVSCM